MRIPTRISALALALLSAASAQSVETLDPSQGPGDAASAMYTVEDIYDRLTTGAAGVLRGAAFAEPVAVPESGDTGHTLNDVMAALPVKDNTNGATSAQVLADKTFWGLRTDGTWGLTTGQMTDHGALEITPGAAAQNIPAGYHNGSGKVAGDTDLTAAKIKKDVEIFGVTGSGEIATGTAAAADVLATKTFSNASAVGVTGTMPNNGTVTITPGTAQQTVAAGYHDGNGKVVGDADLAAANIAKDVVIFGTTGTTVVSRGDATAGHVMAGKTFSNQTAVGVAGTMVDHGAVVIVPGTSAKTIPEGYHNGSGVAAGDPDLAPANIPLGVNILGVVGTADLAAGDAEESDVLAGQTFSVSGDNSMTGSMPDVSADITPTGAEIPIPAGYHDGTKNVLTDTDLQSENIRSGVNIYGVVGDSNVVDTSTGDASDADISTGKIGWVDGTEVTGAQTKAPIPKTGLSLCYDKAGDPVTPCTGTGQDGALQKGVARPTPRFTEKPDGTILDNLTGLIWMKNANCNNHGKMLWQAALDFVTAINAGTYPACQSGASDWRLPNSDELKSLIDYSVEGAPKLTAGHPFLGVKTLIDTQEVKGDWYWSSTTVLGDPLHWGVLYSNYAAWGFNFGTGRWAVYDKVYITVDGAYVWPVRGGR